MGRFQDAGGKSIEASLVSEEIRFNEAADFLVSKALTVTEMGAFGDEFGNEFYLPSDAADPHVIVNTALDKMTERFLTITPPTGPEDFDVVMTALAPVVRYKLDETSGTSAVDSIGAANGTITGTVLFNQTKLATGLPGGSMHFDGVAAEVSIPALATATSLTVMFWGKADDNAAHYRPFALNAQSPYANINFNNAAPDGIRAQSEVGGAGVFVEATQDTTVAHQYVMILTATKLELFIDGVSVASLVLTAPPEQTASGQNNFIGSSRFPTLYHKGNLQEFLYWDHDLSAAEIFRAYRSAAGLDPGLPVTITFNPADKGALITLSNGNLTGTNADPSISNTVRATVGKTSGKFIMEFVADSVPSAGNNHIGVGLATAAAVLGDVGQSEFLGSLGNDSIAYYDGSGDVFLNNASVASYTALTAAGQRMTLAVDLGADRMYVAIEGAWQGGADPVAGTGGIDISTLNAGEKFAAVTCRNGGTVTANLTGPFAATAAGYTAYDAP